MLKCSHQFCYTDAACSRCNTAPWTQRRNNRGHNEFTGGRAPSPFISLPLTSHALTSASSGSPHLKQYQYETLTHLLFHLISEMIKGLHQDLTFNFIALLCSSAGMDNPEDLCILYSNRAACYLKDGNSTDCIQDCTKCVACLSLCISVQ